MLKDGEKAVRRRHGVCARQRESRERQRGVARQGRFHIKHKHSHIFPLDVLSKRSSPTHHSKARQEAGPSPSALATLEHWPRRPLKKIRREPSRQRLDLLQAFGSLPGAAVAAERGGSRERQVGSSLQIVRGINHGILRIFCGVHFEIDVKTTHVFDG